MVSKITFQETKIVINLFFFFLISGGIMFQYFVKVVPTIYHHLNGEVMDTNQFAVTKHTRTVRDRYRRTGTTRWVGRGRGMGGDLGTMCLINVLPCAMTTSFNLCYS